MDHHPPPASLLYLCGASGTGKSSLVAASLVPALGDLGWATLSLRLGPDPAGSIRDGLLAAPDLVGRAADTAPLTDLLARASRRREGKPPLLLVIDQFEEVLILNDDAQRKPLADLLHGLAKTPLPGLRLLLVFRSDYRELIFKLGLPDYVPQQNAFELAPFSRAEAEGFLRAGAPILSGGYDDLFAGLDRVEDARGLYRPITLNMIGLVLGRMGARVQGDPARLIESYLRRCIEGPSRDFSRLVLAPMITTAGTKEPQSLEALTTLTRLEPWRIRSTLTDLGAQGLVRELGPGLWEISHDFLARQLGQILGRLRRPWLRRTAPIALPAAALGWALLLFGALDYWPTERERRALEELTEMRIDRFVAQPGYGLRLAEPRGFDDAKLRRAVELARQVRNLTTLDLSGAQELLSLDGLHDLPTLTTLNLSGASAISSLKGLRDLPALTTLNISGLYGITSLEPLRGLPTLTTLKLRKADGIISLEGLEKLLELKTLDLAGSRALTNLEGLQDLLNLTTLNLSWCYGITSLQALRNLPSLTVLDLSNSDGITSLKGMRNLPKLTTLDLSKIDGITSLAGLKDLPALSRLNLSWTTEISSLEDLRGLPELTTLDLSRARGLISLEGLQDLPKLTSLNLSWAADGLTSMRGLRDLPALTTLDLSHSDGIANLEELRGLPSITTLYLSDADGITSLKGLRDLPALTWLDLSGADGITSLEALRGLPLKKLVLGRPEVGWPIGKAITTLAPLKGMDPAIVEGATPELLATMR